MTITDEGIAQETYYDVVCTHEVTAEAKREAMWHAEACRMELEDGEMAAACTYADTILSLAGVLPADIEAALATYVVAA